MADPRVNVVVGAKDEATKVVKGIRGQFETFKKDAITGFGLGAGINVFNLGMQAFQRFGDVVGDTIQAASDLAESQSKVNVVFAEGADEVHDWAEEAATSMGMARREALEAAGTFGNFIQALGNSRDEAQDMSLQLVQLAADLGSFNNTDISEVILALRSGLAGEAEPMRRLGVSISATRVEANILAKGLAKTKAEITDAMKVSERYAIIMEDTALAQGDFERTSDGLANQTKILNAQLSTASEEVGQKLLPAMLKLVNLANQYVVPALDAVADSLGLITGESEHTLTATDILEQKTREWALANNNAVASAAILADEMGAVYTGAAKAAVTMDDLAVTTDATADEQKDLARALELVAGGFQGLRQDARETERMWRRMAADGDRNKKRIRELREEVDRWGRRYKRAVRENDSEAAAFASAQQARSQQELTDRGAVRDSINTERRALENLMDTPDDKTTLTIDVVGEESIAAAARTISNLAAMSGNVISVFLQGISGKRASGGPVSAGKTYLVGEKGPELLHMGSQSGRMTPTNRMGGGGDVYLDGHWVGKLLDERMGRQYARTASPGSYRG